MTLRRLLVAGVTLAFLVLLAGIETIAVHNTRQALQQQLETHAQETATSLALSLGALLKGPDAALAATVINPVFDRGYFAAVRLAGLDGRELVARTLAPDAAEVPGWFRALFSLEAPAGEALVASGWRQLGRVTVVVHPEFAYRQLWRAAWETLAWFALLYLAALLAVGRYVSAVLRPLDAIERAAVAVSERDFRAVEIDAPTVELRRVGAAMSSLAAKVRDAMAQESARAERMLEEANEDPVTRRLNHRGFLQRARVLTAGESDIYRGALALFLVRGLQDINRSEGTAAADDLLRGVGEALCEPVAGRTPLVGRHEGAAFVVFLPNVAPEDLERWARAVVARAREQRASVCAGVVRFEAACPAIEELEQWAQVALARAEQAGSEVESLNFDAGVRAWSGTDWRGALESALAEGRLALYGQRVFGLPGGHLLHVEVMLALAARGGTTVPGGTFLPAAARSGLMPRIDCEVARRVAALAGPAAPERLAVNVATQSIDDPGYRAVLAETFERHPGLARRLVFELNAYGATRRSAAAEGFARAMRSAGAGIALDNVELSPDTLVLARALLPQYVKLAPAHARDLAERPEARFLLESIVAILRPLEVPVIVKGVEDASLVEIISRAGASGYQGYASDRPARIDSPGP